MRICVVKEEKGKKDGENRVTKSFIVCTFLHIFSDDRVKDKMGAIHSTNE